MCAGSRGAETRLVVTAESRHPAQGLILSIQHRNVAAMSLQHLEVVKTRPVKLLEVG